MLEARLLNQIARVRSPTGHSANGADAIYAAAVDVVGYWKTDRRKVPAPGGGWQNAVDHWFITNTQITYDQLVFRPDVDATVESNGQNPRMIETHFDPYVTGSIHHYEVML